jgi:hypothetical protein
MKDEHNVRLKRPHGFYISDNELVDKLAAEIGIYAFGVYHMLLRRAENREGASVSLREIGSYLAINKNAVASALARLKSAGLIEETPSKLRSVAPTYVIVQAKDVITDRTSNAHLPQPCPSTGTRKKQTLVPPQGQAVSLQKDTLSLHRDTLVPPEGHLIRKKTKTLKQVQDNSPLPPSRGVNDHEGEVEVSFDLKARLGALARKCAAETRWSLQGVKASFNGVIQDLHGALIDASLANVHKGKPGLRDGAQEFRKYFEDVAVGDYEAAEGTSELIVLVLRTRDPVVTQKGFTIYRARIERSMQKYFGRVVQVRFEEA